MESQIFHATNDSLNRTEGEARLAYSKKQQGVQQLYQQK